MLGVSLEVKHVKIGVFRGGGYWSLLCRGGKTTLKGGKKSTRGGGITSWCVDYRKKSIEEGEIPPPQCFCMERDVHKPART